MERENPSEIPSKKQSETAPKFPYPIVVGIPSLILIFDGLAKSDENEMIAGICLIAVEAVVMYTEKKLG